MSITTLFFKISNEERKIMTNPSEKGLNSRETPRALQLRPRATSSRAPPPPSSAPPPNVPAQLPGSGRAGAHAPWMQSTPGVVVPSSDGSRADERRDVAPSIGGGGPGGDRQVPRVGASPRRPPFPSADAQDRPGPAAEPARYGGPRHPAHSYRGGADGTAAVPGHGSRARG